MNNDFTNCPYWGIGGRYTADPVTGVRTPVADTPDPAAAPAATVSTDTVVSADPATAVDPQPVKPVKEKK